MDREGDGTKMHLVVHQLVDASTRTLYGLRAMQFSIFPWFHWIFGPFPPARGKAGMGGKRRCGLPAPCFTPTLTLPRVEGEGRRPTGEDVEN